MTKIENLPAKLRETGLFCCWRYEEGAGDKKPRKVPYNPRTGGRAQGNNPDTFAPLEVAMAASGSYDGLGVGVFNSLGAIDIDQCVGENGEISEMAADIRLTMGAYTEYSPSGRGLRILFNASDFWYDKAKYYIKNDDLGLEVYIAGNTSRFVTLTGNALTPGLDLEERGEQLAAVLEKYMTRPAKPTLPAAPSRPVENAGALDDMALIELAKRSKNGAEFTNLWAGDTSAYGGDDSGVLADIDPEGEVPGWQRAMQKRKPKEAKAKERKDSIALAFEACGIDGKVTVSALAEYMGVTDKTVRNRLKEHGGFWIDEGEVGRK